MVLDVALSWYARGFLPIPCAWGTKRPLVRWSRFLRPRVARPGVAVVERWFSQPWRVSPEGVNLALVCGVGDLCCLDFDSESLYRQFRAELPKLTTRTTKTPRPGYHVWLRVRRVDRQLVGIEGVEIKTRSTVVDFPAMHPSGEHYEPVTRGPVAEVGSLAFLADCGLAHKRPVVVKPTEPYTRSFEGWVEFDAVRRSVNMLALLEPFDPVPSGGAYQMIHCPFHGEDAHRSMWVNVASRVVGCFRPDCKAYGGMDIIRFYGEVHDLDYRSAALALQSEVSDGSTMG